MLRSITIFAQAHVVQGVFAVRVFFVSLRPMAPHSLYEAVFRTKKGTVRRYIGISTDVIAREEELQTPGERQPVWLKAGCSDFHFVVLMRDIPTKHAALVVEALMAAHRWKRHPHTARGGPWSRRTLSEQDEIELKMVAKCTTVRQVLEVAEGARPRGSLSVHLKDLSFSTSPAATLSLRPKRAGGVSQCPLRLLPCPRPPAAALLRVSKKRASGKSKKSGVSGHIWRGGRKLKFGDLKFTKAKWGSEGLEAKRRHQRDWKARNR